MTALPSPKDVLDFWIGEAGNSAEAATSKNKMWFAKSAKIDSDIRKRFLSLLETLAAGPLADDWSGRGARERLAAIIVLDASSSICPSNIQKISAIRPAPSKCFQRCIRMPAAISGN